jgi:hypothetical protein
MSVEISWSIAKSSLRTVRNCARPIGLSDLPEEDYAIAVHTLQF